MIMHGDCLDVLAGLPENSVDTCITDPPYELGFMGKKWDNTGVAFQPETWAAVYRVLKPGAILLAFGGTRTFHRLVCAIEDAGFEIRDSMAWLYGSGFPKSYDISKGVDKQAGADREILSSYEREGRSAGIMGNKAQIVRNITAPATPAAQLWHGWGTALKPAMELICVAMKPIDGTYVNNALTWGVAGLWIDGGRVKTDPEVDDPRLGGKGEWHIAREQSKHTVSLPPKTMGSSELGRFPANVIHDGSDEVKELFPQNAGAAAPASGKTYSGTYQGNCYGVYNGNKGAPAFHNDSGSAARFFYCAKASRSERNAGLEGMEERIKVWNGQSNKSSSDIKPVEERWTTKMQNTHPTVKPLALMRYLARLTKTPTGGVVLDPFMGSGTTGIACVLEGREFIGIEREAEYVEIAEKRIAHYRLPILDEA